MKPKLIVTDLDGTALRNDKTLSEETIEAFARCKENNIPVAIATARYIIGAKPYADALQADYQILTDGTLVLHNGEIIYSNTMDLSMTNQILQQLYQKNFLKHIAVPTAEGLFRYPLEFASPAMSPTASEQNKDPQTPGIYFDITKEFPYPANKMVVELPYPEAAKEIASACGCKQFQYRNENRYTFFHPTASKLNAISFLASRLQISLRDILVFGDDINDIEMITHCGCSVAMGNALDEVKDAADFVTDSNEKNGVAAFLLHHVLSSR